MDPKLADAKSDENGSDTIPERDGKENDGRNKKSGWASVPGRLWERSGLDVDTLKLMFK